MAIRRFFPRAWAVALAVSFISSLLAISIPLPFYELHYIRIKDRFGVPLWVLLYTPDPAKHQPAPGAVVCQPINDSPEYGRLLDLELVRDGFVVLTFDWRGRAPDENRQALGARTQETLRADMAAAVSYLRAMPGVDPDRIVVAGHSVGGTLAIDAGLADKRIAAVASIGMDADVTPSEPRNLLWAVGLYDEFRESLDHMRRVFSESSNSDAREETTVGDFGRGTARRLGVSPTSDHFTELQDRGIQREVINWFRQAVGLPQQPLSDIGRLESLQLLLVVSWLSAIGCCFLLLRFLSGRPNRIQVLRVVNAAAFAATFVLIRIRGVDFLQDCNGVFALLVLALFCGFVSSLDSETCERAWRFTARAGLVLWASLLATFAAINLPYYFQNPRYLLSFPEFAIRHLLDLADGYVFNYPRPILFSVYDPEHLILRWWVYAILILVTIVPDWLALLVKRVRLLRQEDNGVKVSAPRVRVSPVSLVVLVILLGLLGSIVMLRLQQGFLTGESARAALQYLIRYTILPIIVFALLWRATANPQIPASRSKQTPVVPL